MVYPVLEDAECLLRQQVLRNAVMIVKPCLCAPADMKSGGNICLGPVHNMGQLIPVLNLLVLHLLHRCAGDDQSVKVLVFYIVKGLIELI